MIIVATLQHWIRSDGSVMDSLYTPSNHVYFLLCPVITARVRFAQELTASKVRTYEFVLLQKGEDY